MEILVLQMSTIDSSSPLSDYSPDKKFDMIEDEDIALILTMRANKRPKYGGSVFGHEFLRRTDKRLTIH